jgi:D-alanyl-D-alanine carboxypeptidase/D-alanyl-D-alanine-endopeptidase (penicillin-binding protein 4)
MKKIVVILLLILLFASCGTVRKSLVKRIDTQIKSDQYDNQFTGFLIIEPKSKDTIYNINSIKYFTPASTTKIFTLFASLNLIPDSIPTLKYVIENDTLYVQGTGDPTVLHPYFNDSTAIHFMEKYENIALNQNNFKDEKFGPGWSWDDYHLYYSPERSGLPLYGNILTIANADSIKVHPQYFKDSIVFMDNPINRELQKNIFYYNPLKKDTVEIPFRVDPSTTKNFLEQSLKKKIHGAHKIPDGEWRILYGMPSDSVYKRMMEVSDNFLAEQLLIVGSATLSDTLNSHKAREFVLENYLTDLRQPPRWVDGSGLSRYNLFTPESMVHVLQKLYNKIPRERLFQFFPTGGVSGTMEDWYPGSPDPYIYAKTGSLGNNHSLSGYLLTNSGKTLVFSFMNNHFMENPSEIKKRMQSIFEDIRDNY